MKTSRHTLVATGFLAAFLLPAHADANPAQIVGKWDCLSRDGPDASVRALLEYQTRSKFSHKMNIAVRDAETRVDASISLMGRWELAGENLVEIATTARLTSLKFDGVEVANKPVGREIRRNFIDEFTGANGISTSKVVFKDANRINLTAEGLTTQCDRRAN